MLFKKTLLLAAVICLFRICITAQILPPYSENFDAGSVGWTHYAINGQDDWQLGAPACMSQTYAFSAPNCWATNLTGNYTSNSIMCLESPSFDLSQVAQSQVLSFYHDRLFNSNTYGVVQYSTDGGVLWYPLYSNNAALYQNWYSNINGFGTSNPFQRSCFSLGFLTGQADVRIRFMLSTSAFVSCGWLIDNFSIGNELYNVSLTNCDSIQRFSPLFPVFTVSADVNFQNQYSAYFPNTLNYYFSNDNTFDLGDSLIHSYTVNHSGSLTNFSQTINTPPNLQAGYYYIFIQADSDDTLSEYNENDNLCYAVLKVDSSLSLPYIDDFENDSSEQWQVIVNNQTCSIPSYWTKGYGFRHHLEGAHSDSAAWHTSQAIINYPGPFCGGFVESPFINLSTAPNPVLCFWYKNHSGLATSANYNERVCYSTNGSFADANVVTYFSLCENDDWDFRFVSLSSISSQQNVKFGFLTDADTMFHKEGLMFDDLYIGSAKPDLSIEGNKQNRITSTSVTADTLRYRLTNSGVGSTSGSSTYFFWSTDNIFDSGDVLLGSKIEPNPGDTASVWTYFAYNKPSLVQGDYFIFYTIDSLGAIQEMREYNNHGFFEIRQQNTWTLPYSNDFETQITDWHHESSLGADDWNWSTPTSSALSPAFSGTKAWITNAHGDSVSPMSRFHLYTPIFDFSTISNPIIEFDLIHKIWIQNGTDDIGTNISFSVDGGATWIVLDTTSQSFKEWYYREAYNDIAGIDEFPVYALLTNGYLFSFEEPLFIPTDNDYQTRDTRRTTHFTLDIGFLTGQKNVQFRFNYAVFNSRPPGTLLDNFSISEATVDFTIPYQKNLMWSSQANKLRFYTDFLNNGNDRSLSSDVQFFLSADSIPDGSDIQLGSEYIPELRPEYSHMLNLEFNMPANASTYHYLIILCDPNNTVVESDETNNIVAWPLGLDSNIVFPYFNDFSAAQIDGWTWYHNDSLNQLYNGFRFRHKKLVGEDLSVNVIGCQTDEWFLDRIYRYSTSYSLLPTYFLESPVFNFSTSGTIVLDFDFICFGETSQPHDGGNMQYSIDGGNTWLLLDYPQVSSAQQWYNSANIVTLNGQAGWHTITNGDLDFQHASADVSFLSGQTAVKFRYAYKSFWTLSSSHKHGFRLDNFQVTTTPVSVPENSTSPQLSFFNQNGMLTASLSSPIPMQNAFVEIYDASGRLVYTQTSDLGAGVSVIPLTGNLNDGIYFLKISHVNQNFHARTCFVK
ncbi:MAG: CARDB domain-containing protein [Bacteroidia bacterium]